ncbi:Hypothetical_protein [Hexamita inflata]|uniref:Hypothetical_protein n=1 Tax=Hexamita inflata TaxID=28002 RepID=A0AA86S2Z3_9EUKA|nr:Hypothetical protein HINF_LOCUS64780 [Hexamita inflata]
MGWRKDLDGFGRNNFIYDYIIAYIMIMNTYIERKYHNFIISSEISTNQIMSAVSKYQVAKCYKKQSKAKSNIQTKRCNQTTLNKSKRPAKQPNSGSSCYLCCDKFATFQHLHYKFLVIQSHQIHQFVNCYYK